MTLEQLIHEAKRLDLDQRTRLAFSVWASVEQECSDAPMPPELREEIDRRMAYMHAHPKAWVPLQEVLNRLKSKAP